MKVEKLTIRLGRTVPGPEYGGSQFANVKPEVEITVLVGPGDNIDDVKISMSNYCLSTLQYLKQELINDQVKVKPQQPTQRPVVPSPVVMVQQPPPPPSPVNCIPKVDPVTW